MQQLDSAERAAAVMASQHREGLGEGARECGHGGRAEQQLRVRQAGPQRRFHAIPTLAAGWTF